jgi:hypothetical protein
VPSLGHEYQRRQIVDKHHFADGRIGVVARPIHEVLLVRRKTSLRRRTTLSI